MGIEASSYDSGYDSAIAAGQWNQSGSFVINDNRARRDYDYMKAIIQKEEIDTNEKVDLITKLSGLDKTMAQGGFFMIKNRRHHFVDFEKALSALKMCETKNPETLIKVESLLQTQADAIINMNSTHITKEEKSMCLYAVHKFILGLGDFELKKTKNTYVPQLKKDMEAVEAKAIERGLDVNKIHKYVYTKQHAIPEHTTLKDFNYLDSRKVKELKDEILSAHQSFSKLTQFKHDNEFDMATTQREKIEDGIVTFKPNGDVQDPTMQFIGEILSKAYHKFTANELKADPQKLFPKLFSFIDQNLSALNLGRETIFELTRQLTIKIGRDNANVQASIYQANNDMGRTM